MRSLGVAAGFSGAHIGARYARRLGGNHQQCLPNADVGRAALDSSFATGQVTQSPTCCAISSPSTCRLVHFMRQSSACCKHTYLTEVVHCFRPKSRRRKEEKRSWESVSCFHHLQLRLQTRSIGIKWGRGEKPE